MKLYDDLVWRGLIQDISDPKLEELLNNGGLTFYIGTDPTSDSMHIGHFSSFLLPVRLKRTGHNPILLIGVATGLIGDPKPSSERPMLSKEEVFKNGQALTKQAKDLFGFEVVNNYDWCKDINFIDYLRDYGKYFNINYMLDKDIIRRRLDTGITYTEFSYMIIQALDFLHLYETRNCTLQLAGSDQWGNITAGIELIRKKIGKEAYGFTMPLITDVNGVKFGKTEGNALWLDENKTSSYELYQYLINTNDNIVIKYLKAFTFLSKEEIETIEKEMNEHPENRLAQETLAREIIIFLHGKESYEKAINLSKLLFNGKVDELTDKEIEQVFKDTPNYTLEKEMNILEALTEFNICLSRREARELLNSNAINLNGKIINDENEMLDKNKKYNIIRKGKKKYYVIKNKVI